MRQVGGDDSAIYKTTRCETYPASIAALGMSIVLFVVIILVYVMYSFSNLTIMADKFKSIYTTEVIAKCRQELWNTVSVICIVYLLVIPLHIVSGIIRALLTIPPTRRAIKGSIT